MTQSEKLHELIQECINTGTGACVLVTGPHGSGKTFMVNSTVKLFSHKINVVNFPGALARHSLTVNPQKELLRLLHKALREENVKYKKDIKLVESLEDFFEIWPMHFMTSQTKPMILIIEDVDLV